MLIDRIDEKGRAFSGGILVGEVVNQDEREAFRRTTASLPGATGSEPGLRPVIAYAAESLESPGATPVPNSPAE